MSKTNIDQARTAARRRGARRWLDKLDETREAKQLADTGYSQRQIAEILDTTQPRVGRLLQSAQRRAEVTPEELIKRAWVEGGDRDQLVDQLSDWSYTFREYPPEAMGESIPGTWDQVMSARTLGMLTADEYKRIKSAVDSRQPDPAKSRTDPRNIPEHRWWSAGVKAEAGGSEEELSTGRNERTAEPSTGQDELLTPTEVAQLFGVDPKTVSRWVKTGKLSSVMTIAGHRRYRAEEVSALAAGRSKSRHG